MDNDEAKEWCSRFNSVGVMYITITVGLIGPLNYDQWAAAFLLVFVCGQLFSIKEIYNPFQSDSMTLQTSQILHYGLPYLLGLLAIVWGIIASLSCQFQWI
ncbi:hypothetical protein [Candidatus Nitrospira salsa]